MRSAAATSVSVSERVPEKLAEAPDARHRLAREPPRHITGEARRHLGQKRVAAMGDQALMGESGGMTQQNPRIERRQIDTAVPQHARRHDMSRIEGRRRIESEGHASWLSMAASWLAWSSVISASMISSSAGSPCSTRWS